MIKTMKKIFASVIAAAMILTAAPLSGIAQLDFSGIFAPEASALNVSGSCGENVTYTFDASKLLVTISGTGPMTDYSPESHSPFSDYAGTIYVVIEDGVTSIGDYAFYGRDLRSLEIADSVVRIGDYAAGNCDLYRINIPKSVTYIGEHVFDVCPELAIITVDADNSVYDSRNNCNAIIETATNTLICGCQNTIIPDSVTGIGAYAFCGSGLTDIAIPDSVTSIGNSAFERCYDLTSIDISNGVTSIGAYAFDHTGFTNITIPDSVTGIGAYAFCGSKLTDIAIPDSVTSISDGAFEFCRSLANVTIPDSVTDIGENAFKNCYALTSIEIPDSVTSIGAYAFCGSKLTDIAIPDSVTSIGDSAFEQCESLTDVTLSDNITNIGKSLFENCLCLTSIIIPDGVTGIEENAFKNCNALTSVEIPDSVTSIEALVFNGCTGLKKVNITSIAAWSVIDFENELSNPLCYAQKLYLNNELVTDLIIPDSVTGISNYAYSGCTDLTSVTIPDSVTSIGDRAFKKCEGLTNVTIPDSVTVIGEYAFNRCLGLKNITLPSGVTCIDRYAFCYCPNLTEITIPNSVTSIGEFAFSSCYYLTGIVIPDSVTVIDSFAFYECASITSVTIGENVKSIGRYAFGSCNKIKDVYFSGSRSQWAEINIGIYNDTLLNAAIHYGKEDTSGALSDTVSYTYDKDTGVLTISGTGAIPTYVSASASPFAGREFSEIIIEEGITEIGSYVFPNCDIGTLSTPITLDNVKDNAFAGSTADNIIVNYYLGEDGAFDVGETGNEMLADPSSFEEYVYEIVTDTITACYNGKTMGLTYSGTGAIPDYSTENPCTFAGTGEVHSIVFEEGITHIGDFMLFSCTGIESLTLPDSLESIGEYAFAFDKGLKTVTIGKNLTEIGLAAFTGCYSLEAFNVSADNTAFCSVDGVLYSKDRKELVLYPAGKEDTEFEIPAGTETLCAAAFAECDNLTKVTIPTSVTEIGEAVFNGMDALTDVYYLGTQAEWENITMGDSNTSLRDVTMHYAVGGQLTDTTSWIYNETTQTLTITGTGDCKYDFNYDGETYDFAIKNVVFDTETYNGGYELVFEDLCNAESFRFTSTVTNINISEETHNFCYFYELETIYVDEDNALYESIDGVLFDSVNKKLLVYPAGRSESVYSVPEGTVSIGEVAFYGADMDEVILPDSLIILDYLAFFSCGINRIDLNNVKEVGRQAFLFNESISEVSFGESLESIKSEAFECTALTNAVIPASVKELQINSFSSLKLESVTFKEGFDFITDEYDVSYVRVFDGSVISRLYLPSSITNIPYGLFYDAEITDVYYNGTKADWAKVDIVEQNDALLNAAVHCTDGDFDLIPLGNGFCYTYEYTDGEEILTIYGEGEMPSDIGNIELPNWINKLQVVFSDGITVVDGLSSIADDINIMYPPTYYIPETVTEIRDGAFIRTGEPGGHIIFGGTYVQWNNEVTIENKETNMAYVSVKQNDSASTGDNYNGAGWVFYDDEGADYGLVEINGTGEFWGQDMSAYYDSPFAENTTVQNVIIWDQLTSIGCRLFWECDNLQTVKIIGNDLTTIGAECFQGCGSLNTIYLPGTLETVCADAFSMCDSLYDVYYTGTEEEWEQINIMDGNDALLNANIHFVAPSMAFREEANIKMQIDDGIIYANGFRPGMTASELQDIAESGWEVSIITDTGSDRIGTGTLIRMKYDNVTIDIIAVVYGDTTGDSWYDGQDALITSCISSGMLSDYEAGAAVTFAADCNHDGVIDQLDVDILNQAGVLKAQIDQAKSEEELLETSSAYVQYLNLIQQSPETETTAEEVVEDTPTDVKEPKQINWFEMFVSFLKTLLNFVYGLFTL